MLRTLALHDRSWPFRFDLRAETPVVPLRLRNLEAVTGEEDEGPSEGLVKPWGRFTEVRFNLFRGGSGVTQPIANIYEEIGLYQQVKKGNSQWRGKGC